MKITTFNKIITEAEGKKVSISIAQVAEVMRLVNIATSGALYKEIGCTTETGANALLTMDSVSKTKVKSKSKK